MASAGTAYVDVEAKLDSFAQQIEAAVSGIESQAISIEVDTSEAEASVAAISDGQLSLFVEAETETAQAEVDAVDGGEAEVKVKADTTEAQASVDDLAGSFGGLADAAGFGGGALGGVTEQLAGLTGASTATTAGIGALVGGLVLSANAAGESQAVNAQLDQVLANAGDSAAVTGDHIRGLAVDIMEYSGFSDEAVVSGATLLATFDRISGDQPTFDRTLRASADLAVFMGTDVPSAARTLGRALNDPEQGVSRLARVFPSLTAAQKEAISAMAESGDMAGAQAAILEIVESKVGGLAATYGETLPGAMDRATEATGELAETVGGDLVPALTSAIEDTTSWVQAMTEAKDDVAGIAGGLMGDVQGALLEGGLKSLPIIGPVVSAVDALRGAFGGADSAGKALGDALGTKTNPALAETGDAADDAAYAISGLDARVQGYLNGVFRVPEAERALRESFAGLDEVLADPARTADDVAVSLQEIVTNAAGVGTATGNMTGAVDAAVFGLAGLQAQGKLSASEVAEVRSQLESLPGNTEANVSAPGAELANTQARNLGNALLGLPPGTSTTVEAPGLSGVYTSTRNLRAEMDNLDGRTVTTYVGVQTTGSAKVSAVGGPLRSGELSLVGEEGPEMFVPNTGGNIIPAMQTASLMMGQGATYNINVNAAGGNGDEIARAISDELRKLERASR